MKLEKIVDWLDATLEVGRYDDVSNNGLQIGNDGSGICKVAFAVDGSLRTVKKAIESQAGLLVVHHGISWGGGMRRLTGGLFNVVKAAIDGNLALYACHLPLDAHDRLGNNARLAQELALQRTQKAFSYHGNVIGLVGETDAGLKIGVCSGGGGEFAQEAKDLGCDVLVTGEASWADVIAAENCGIKLECRGHYETEIYGVRAVAAEMEKSLGIDVVDLTEKPARGDVRDFH